jgi:hypothetical protein
MSSFEDLDDLVALLGPNPDYAIIDARFRRYVLEGLLVDERGTPTERWRQILEHNESPFTDIVWDLFGRAHVNVPFFEDDLQEWNATPYCPRFRRVVWLELFHDLVPSALQQRRRRSSVPSVKLRRSPEAPAKHVTQKTIEKWMLDEWLAELAVSGEEPTRAAAWEAAKRKFGSKVTRQPVRDALTKLRPDLEKRGPRGPRKLLSE